MIVEFTAPAPGAARVTKVHNPAADTLGLVTVAFQPRIPGAVRRIEAGYLTVRGEGGAEVVTQLWVDTATGRLTVQEMDTELAVAKFDADADAVRDARVVAATARAKRASRLRPQRDSDDADDAVAGAAEGEGESQ